MADNHDRINELLKRLDRLSMQQEEFQKEIKLLKEEVNHLQSKQEVPLIKEKETEPAKVEKSIDYVKEITIEKEAPVLPKKETPLVSYASPHSPKVKSNLEKFIGENLISKIGIIITVIGVAIGAKYAIDHELINPLTRIILGYLFGAGLLGLAIWLKQKYDKFSAVLLSGSMAIMYFITYAAYDFYALIPQFLAFVLMVAFTVFTALAAITYNRQVIAHIGLVGAYIVPFLLSSGSGQALILFSYTAIINLGILAIALKKYWKPLYYSSFVITWIIYSSWFFFKYQSSYFTIAFVFNLVFFIIFYLTFLGYKLLRQSKYNIGDIILLLSNSFIFYGFGYAILNKDVIGEHLLGLFTLGNAIIHFIVAIVIYKQKMVDRNLLHLVIGLVLVFITIAIPVQLEGNWVTLLWAGEAALLYWIGRSRKISIYEKLSFPIMLVAFFSMIHDWFVHHQYFSGTPVFNIHFLSSLLFAAAFGFIVFLNQNKKYTDNGDRLLKNTSGIVSFFVTGIFLVSLYATFYMEISVFFELYEKSGALLTEGDYNAVHEIALVRQIWLINYSMFFLTLLSFVNIRKIRNKVLGYFNVGINIFAVLFFLSNGMNFMTALRASDYPGFYFVPYLSYIFLALLLLVSFMYTRNVSLKLSKMNAFFELFIHFSILWVASNELIYWLGKSQYDLSYSLELSIFWGIYSLVLIILGIWKKKKYLRIGAITLFGITLVKLFFYDLSGLSTIGKTIVFISLGALLLLISFLYNKYKHVISDETKGESDKEPADDQFSKS
ncbi:MAG: DUF2339 domain-containing protein [Bacteroidales bacterium]|jgi:uncharacterized membrane protein|nr:DUF2339 domain-containing protein [Bacteroidales bacterium]